MHPILSAISYNITLTMTSFLFHAHTGGCLDTDITRYDMVPVQRVVPARGARGGSEDVREGEEEWTLGFGAEYIVIQAFFLSLCVAGLFFVYVI